MRKDCAKARPLQPTIGFQGSESFQKTTRSGETAAVTEKEKKRCKQRFLKHMSDEGKLRAKHLVKQLVL